MIRYLPAILLLGTLALAVFLTTGGCSGGGDRPNILLITIDTLRADHLGCYGYDRWDQSPSPVLDDLASRGVLFERCLAPRGQTHPSIATMLTGKYPITHILRENGQWLDPRHTSFVQLLKMRGYRTAGFAANLYKEQNPLERGSDPNWWTRGFEAYDDGYGGNYLGETKLADIEDQWTWDERVEKRTLEWIEGLDAGDDKPFFAWTHFYDPHKPYHRHPSCPDFYPDYEGPLEPQVGRVGGKRIDRVAALIDPATRDGRPLDPKDYDKVMALYDASIWGADQRVGRILEALKKKGLAENTWVVITADHGDELGDHNHYYYHGASIYNAVLHIPLIVAGPLPEGGRKLDALVQNVDLAPTLLDLAGAPPLAGAEGETLVPLIFGQRDRIDREFAVAEWINLIYAYTDGTYKYIYNPKGICPKKPPFIKKGYFDYDLNELYHLETDPREQNNIFKDHQELSLDLRKKLGNWINRPGHHPEADGKISNTQRDVISGLGYTGGGSVRKKRNKQ